MAKRTVDYDLIVSLWDQGSSFREIMKTVHCCDGTIRNALEAAGRELPLDRPMKRYLQDKVPIYP